MTGPLQFDFDIRFCSVESNVLYQCEVEGCSNMTDGGFVRPGYEMPAILVCDDCLNKGLQLHQPAPRKRRVRRADVA